jgi:hypothetical protein
MTHGKEEDSSCAGSKELENKTAEPELLEVYVGFRYPCSYSSTSF